MGYPKDILESDDSIVVHLHPHWKKLIFPTMWVIVVGVGAGYLLTAFDNSVVRWSVLIVGVVLLLWLGVLPVLRWATTHFVLTQRRIMTRSGLLNRKGRDIPLRRVVDVSYESTLFERVLGVGTIIVQSAGENGKLVFNDIPHAEYVQSQLHTLSAQT